MRSQGLKKLRLPDAPGVYFFKDNNNKGKTLYIGRATSLRSRVRSYFSDDVISTRGSRIVDMVTRAKTIAFEKTDSVLEAIILEANLIKKYQPKYNVDEKDDKSWNYIVITDEEWPRVIVERGRNLEKGKEKSSVTPAKAGVLSNDRVLSKDSSGINYEQSVTQDSRFRGNDKSYINHFDNIFGPYPAGGLLKDALKIIRRIFPYLDEKSLDPKHRAFYASIGLSPAISEERGNLGHKEYLETIKNIKLFLQGKKKTIIKNLKKEMMQYARHQEFEKADKAKRTIHALEHIEDVALIKNEEGTLGSDTFRIEAYDIAHLSGKNVVGVMTVVENGELNKSEYRKFKISHQKNDDVAALREVLLRRLGHTEWPYPSLIVVDGGQAQLNAAQKVLSELKSDILVVAVVKDEKHKAKGIIVESRKCLVESMPSTAIGGQEKNDSVRGTRNLELLLSQYKRAIILANSEAHRFAIAYHKNLRKRNFLKR